MTQTYKTETECWWETLYHPWRPQDSPLQRDQRLLFLLMAMYWDPLSEPQALSISSLPTSLDSQVVTQWKWVWNGPPLLPNTLSPNASMHRHTDLLQLQSWREKGWQAILLSHYNAKYHSSSSSDSLQTLLYYGKSVNHQLTGSSGSTVFPSFFIWCSKPSMVQGSQTSLLLSLNAITVDSRALIKGSLPSYLPFLFAGLFCNV